MNEIKLPPLPRLQVPCIDADVDLMDIRRLAQWAEGIAKDYAITAIEAALQSPRLDGAEVTTYTLPGGISVERCTQRDGTFLWAVRDSFKNCLSKSGEWDCEPSPSARTKEWIDQNRFINATEAIDHARRIAKQKERI